MNTSDVMYLVSACLVGINCRYDGKNKPNEKLIEMLQKGELIPVCPEQLGGLTTPREPAEQKEDKVFTFSGKDVTQNFHKGAEEVLNIVNKLGIKEAILKQKSSSCGCDKIYDGTFSNRLIEGDGVTTALLRKNGIKVYSEDSFE